MLMIEFPKPQFAIQEKEGKEYILDKVRKKWVRLTPEEWVRQNILQYLIQIKNYPAALLAIEKEIFIGEVKKRCDIIVYKDTQPWMIIECKQPQVALTEDTLMQAIRYNMANCCTYLVISNGNYSKGWCLKNGNVEEIKAMPEWKQG